MACPWAPVHAHVILLGWVAFTLFGLVYRALPDWGSPTPTAVRVAGAHLWLSVVSVLGVYGNGIFGYRLLDRISPGFYYKPDMKTLRLWMTIDGWFLTLFAVGCLLHLWILFDTTTQRPKE